MADFTLDDFLVSIQKAFSRTSEKTRLAQDQDGEKAVSAIYDDIDFEAELEMEGKADKDDANKNDKLVIKKGGPIKMKLTGTISHDTKQVTITSATTTRADDDYG